MNSLSWLLYLAGVAGNFGWLLFWSGLLAVVGGLILYAVSFELKASGRKEPSGYDYRDDTSERYKQAIKDKASATKLGVSVSFWGRFITITGIVCWVLAAATPSKETVYAIAASEMGEELLKTPTAAKATKALDAWLDKQIAENTKPAAQ